MSHLHFEEIVSETSPGPTHSYFIATFDFTSLITNLPLDECGGLCFNQLFANRDIIEHNSCIFDKLNFRNLLSFVVIDNHFVFDERLYDQIDGVAVDSPMCPSLANLSMCALENGTTGEWFRTTVGARQGCLLSPTLFNVFLERIMTDALADHEGSVSIYGRTITNLRFADDIDGLAGSEEELISLVDRLDTTSQAYGMEISAEKTKVMTNKPQDIKKEIKVKGQKLETVNSFKYLGAIVTDEGSKPEVLARIAQTTAALAKLKTIWRDRNISLASKIRFMHTLAISVFLYACESWTLTAELQRLIKALEMRCYRKILNISYNDHIINEEFSNRITRAIGPYEDLLSIVKSRKLKWYGHVS